MIGGRISTGNYKDKDGKTIYTTDVIVEEHEFAQNKDNGAGCGFVGNIRKQIRMDSWKHQMVRSHLTNSE